MNERGVLLGLSVFICVEKERSTLLHIAQHFVPNPFDVCDQFLFEYLSDTVHFGTDGGVVNRSIIPYIVMEHLEVDDFIEIRSKKMDDLGLTWGEGLFGVVKEQSLLFEIVAVHLADAYDAFALDVCHGEETLDVQTEFFEVEGFFEVIVATQLVGFGDLFDFGNG